MNFFQKHKNPVSAVLLLLYLFISVPVSFWHQHHYKNNYQTDKYHADAPQKQTDNSTLTDTAGIAENCFICSHHYSFFYTTDCISFTANKPVFIAVFNSLYTEREVQPFLSAIANKGPPLS